MDDLYTFDPLYQRLLGMDINGMDMGGGMKVRGLKNAAPMAGILSLSGKVAVVTGGARGLGLCIVNRLCEAGASVVIADIAVEFAEAAVRYFTDKGCANIKFVKTDVRYLSEIQAAVDFTVAEFGKVDILVNNAAIWKMNRFLDMTEETWDATIDVDLKGTVFFTQAVARQMVKQGMGGKIVNVASVAGLSMESAYGFLTQYVAAKSGVVGISQSLARELKPLGININCVLPGGMLSPGAIHGAPAPVLREATRNSPTAPVTDPDDVARVVYMLTTGISDYMYGATVVADGGARLMIQK
jgi:NAD(P)-dependent dehydrogenase (short-subunit alcohol dehydrogenase family)